ncbi:hypothetical protein UB33_08760 [Photobacterium angustum]|uniref:hypothetical protein n=1 Tax=Photobacterium angustum TaxID=661 RepID=UPI0005E41420|nr:hypothetical protein [Photobacterium angustum]KJF96185.1 hypothetical protein UB39_02275 [Photobacterium angustum]KJG06637.1 hypothetical protein UB33_08760 [Photobacterium angustum]PSV91650.1 hypothetical protein CTN01_13925 [Photobacterium angustum]PSW82381.1 hypothetical protein CTN03_04205 [Photobacterium angustum]
MKKIIIPFLFLALTGCASQLGVVTPKENSYTVEATGSSVQEAKRIANATAEKTCKDLGKSYYVISVNDYFNHAMDENTTELANTASNILLGGNLLNSEHQVMMEFNCK